MSEAADADSGIRCKSQDVDLAGYGAYACERMPVIYAGLQEHAGDSFKYRPVLRTGKQIFESEALFDEKNSDVLPI